MSGVREQAIDVWHAEPGKIGKTRTMRQERIGLIAEEFPGRKGQSRRGRYCLKAASLTAVAFLSRPWHVAVADLSRNAFGAVHHGAAGDQGHSDPLILE